ncbi:nucleoside deaminase [Oceaniglobus ichthyenteri]|jgi:tRNA(Arg) A34 adenosine deaminase TadA|uniref:nucleoside deaminase n=1 Tax=Oceaniglobus ichthyenteri TaxID=2136177 RepID=UPI000D3A9280|nr:nucleoside deaminase [Oceaniglobus ichthyenteri]
MSDNAFMQEAVELARENVADGGQPFGAVLVKDGKVIARAVNRMEAENDPTAHAELMALREAGAALATTRLDGCTVYASGQPCPMCLAAMRIAGISEIVIGYSNENGAPYGLGSADAAAELSQPLDQQDWATIRYLPPDDAAAPEIYRAWSAQSAKKA